MRGDTVRTATIFLSMLLILMLCFCAFFYAGGTLRAEVSCISAPAAEHPDSFEQARRALANGIEPARFSDEALGDASAYTLLDVNVLLSNRGAFDAEWLNVQPLGASGDVAVYALAGDGTDVPARSTGHVHLQYLTHAPADAVRGLKIQYYVYGISRTIEVTF